MITSHLALLFSNLQLRKKPYHVIFNLLMCPQMSTFNRWLCDKRHPVTIILCIFLLPGTSWVLNLSIYKYFIAERFQS